MPYVTIYNFAGDILSSGKRESGEVRRAVAH